MRSHHSAISLSLLANLDRFELDGKASVPPGGASDVEEGAIVAVGGACSGAAAAAALDSSKGGLQAPPPQPEAASDAQQTTDQRTDPHGGLLSPKSQKREPQETGVLPPASVISLAPGQFVPPAQIDEYQIGQRLGRGGMGQVYVGKDTLLERPIAVKFLVSSNPTERARKRFLIEARAIARLQHPNIVGVYRGGISGGHPYLVSELVAGQSLDKLDTPIPWTRALHIGLDIARGLAVVHAHGILHRDIKPSNVMITHDGTAKLLDFGLAKLNGEEQSFTSGANQSLSDAEMQMAVFLDAAGEKTQQEPPGKRHLPPASLDGHPLIDSRARTATSDPVENHALPPSRHGLTEDGEVIGTPMYMPPEMWRGRPATVLSDIYMLGTVLYELCCGGPPHRYPHERLIRHAVLHRDAMPLAQRVHDIDPRFAALIDSCIRRDPEQRPQSAEALLKDLEEILAGMSQPDPAEAARKRRRWTWQLAAIVLLGTLTSIEVFRRPSPSGPPFALSTPQNKPRPRVAVLGLWAPDDTAGRSRRFARAFAELLSAEIAAGQNLLVLANERVEQMKVELGLLDSPSYPQSDLLRIERNLGADLVVIGSLRRAAENTTVMVIHLDILQADTGRSAASTEIRGVPDEMFTMVSRAGRTLRQQLHVQPLSDAENDGLRAARPSSPAVAELYAEGRSRLRHFDPAGARKIFEDVITADADFALGHLALAETLLLLGQENRSRAETARALELSGPLRLEDRYLIEARFAESKADWPRAVGLYQALQTGVPDNLDYGLYLAQAQFRSGDFTEALNTVAKLRKSPAPLSEDARIDLLEAQMQMEHSHFFEATALLQHAAQQGETIQAGLLRAKALSMEAWAQISLGQYEQAHKSAAQARTLYQQSGDPYGVVDTLMATSNAAIAQGDYEQAQKVRQQALDMLIEMRDELLTATHLGNMANLLLQLGELKQATARAEAGLILGHLTGSREATVQALVMLGWAAFLGGQLSLAEHRFFQAREELGEGGDPRQGTWIDWHLGQLRMAQGRLDDSLQLHQQALTLREKLKLEGYIGESQMSLAILYAESGRLTQAEALARKALSGYQSENRADNVAFAFALLCHVLTLEGRTAEAEKAREAAMPQVAHSQNIVLKMRSLALLARHAPEHPEARAQLLMALREGIFLAHHSGLVPDELELLFELRALSPGLPATTELPTAHELSQRAEALGFHFLSRSASSL